MVRLTRVVKSPELEPGGCVLCRSIAVSLSSLSVTWISGWVFFGHSF